MQPESVGEVSAERDVVRVVSAVLDVVREVVGAKLVELNVVAQRSLGSRRGGQEPSPWSDRYFTEPYASRE